MLPICPLTCAYFQKTHVKSKSTHPKSKCSRITLESIPRQIKVQISSQLLEVIVEVTEGRQANYRISDKGNKGSALPFLPFLPPTFSFLTTSPRGSSQPLKSKFLIADRDGKKVFVSPTNVLYQKQEGSLAWPAATGFKYVFPHFSQPL